MVSFRMITAGTAALAVNSAQPAPIENPVSSLAPLVVFWSTTVFAAAGALTDTLPNARVDGVAWNTSPRAVPAAAHNTNKPTKLDRRIWVPRSAAILLRPPIPAKAPDPADLDPTPSRPHIGPSTSPGVVL